MLYFISFEVVCWLQELFLLSGWVLLLLLKITNKILTKTKKSIPWCHVCLHLPMSYIFVVICFISLRACLQSKLFLFVYVGKFFYYCNYWCKTFGIFLAKLLKKFKLSCRHFMFTWILNDECTYYIVFLSVKEIFYKSKCCRQICK